MGLAERQSIWGIRDKLAFVAYKDRKAVAAALKQVYRAADAGAAEAALAAFEEGS